MIKITTIVATFNASEYLQNCIDSYRNQAYDNKELIIIDGGSTDRTIEIVKANIDCIAHWESAPDRGIYDAWNKALERISGEWVIFLGADDVFHDNAVLTRFADLETSLNGDILVAYGNVHWIDAHGKFLETRGRKWNASQFRTVCMTLPHQGVFHRTRLFEEYGKFDISYPIIGDYELLLRHLKDHDAVYLTDLIVCNVYVGGVSGNPSNHREIFSSYVTAQKQWGTYRGNWRLDLKIAIGNFRQLLFSKLTRKDAIFLLNTIRKIYGKPAIY